MKKIGTYLLMGTALISCPCHLVFSLPLVLGLLGGTALGTALAAHTGLFVAAVTAYFLVALIGGSYLLSRLLKDAENGRGSMSSSGRRIKDAHSGAGGSRTVQIQSKKATGFAAPMRLRKTTLLEGRIP